jgi:SPP1 gp7 family putative phage head morphogenesis protein
MKRLRIAPKPTIETSLRRWIEKLLKKVRKKTSKAIRDAIDLNTLLIDYQANMNNISKKDTIAFLDMLAQKVIESMAINIGINQAKEQELIRLFVERTELLITSLVADEYKELNRILTNAIAEDMTIYAISKEIKKTFNMSTARAETIAITETANITSQLNRSRMKEAGIERAIWSSAKDRRVRRCHLARDGEEYDIEKGCFSGCDGRHLQTGQEPRCRCAMVIFVP